MCATNMCSQSRNILRFIPRHYLVWTRNFHDSPVSVDVSVYWQVSCSLTSATLLYTILQCVVPSQNPVIYNICCDSANTSMHPIDAFTMMTWYSSHNGTVPFRHVCVRACVRACARVCMYYNASCGAYLTMLAYRLSCCV